LFLERLLKDIFEAGRVQGNKKRGSKKTSNKFSESEKVYYFCTPPEREMREEKRGSKPKKFFRK